MNNNNLQAGDRGGGRKDFARDLTEEERREEGEKEELLGKYLNILNPDTAL